MSIQVSARDLDGTIWDAPNIPMKIIDRTEIDRQVQEAEDAARERMQNLHRESPVTSPVNGPLAAFALVWGALCAHSKGHGG
jgi:hypothetical protein